MTKREGEGPHKASGFDIPEYGNKRSPARIDHNGRELENEHSPMKHGYRHNSLSGFSDGCFNNYRDSRSAPNSVPGSTAGSRANSRPGSRAGSRMASRCNSQESIIDLFDSMTLKYGSNGDGTTPFNLRSPKPKPLALTKMPYIDRVRVNSAIWRSWHMQYVKKKKSPICQFSSPFVETRPRLVSDVIQGKPGPAHYRPDQLGLVVNDYRKWRLYGKDVLKQLHGPTQSIDPEDNAIDLDSPHPPLSPMSAGKLVNNDLFRDFADTLFISTKKKQFTVPAPKKVTHMFNYIPEVLQPGLQTLQPELDEEFMDTFEFVESLLVKTPIKNDPRNLGIMEELPSALLSYTEEAMQFQNLMDTSNEHPQVVLPGKSVVKQVFPVSLAKNHQSADLSQHSPQSVQQRKVVSFSAPTTPHQSNPHSPVMPQSPQQYHQYQILLPQEYDQSVPLNNQTQTLQGLNFAQFQNDVVMTTAGMATSDYVSRHPKILEALVNAPALPSQQNTISTCPSKIVHSPQHISPGVSPGLSSGQDSPSPAHMPVQESKVECDSPLDSVGSPCMENSSLPTFSKPFISSTVSSSNIGSLTYQLGTSPSSMIPAISQEWTKVLNQADMNWTPATSGVANQKHLAGQFTIQPLITDAHGNQSFTMSANHLVNNSTGTPQFQAVNIGLEEAMDFQQYGNKVAVPSQSSRRRSSTEKSPHSDQKHFKLPSRDTNHRKSPREFFKLPTSLSDSHLQNHGERKSGQHLSVLSPRDERESHSIPVPSSSHTSAASSAASSPGSAVDESLKEFEVNMNNTKRKSTEDQLEEKRQLRRSKHLRSEHKRRYNITSGLEDLQKILPSITTGSNKEPVKYSTAVLLQKGHDHIQNLKDQVDAMRTEKERLNEEIHKLNDDIEKCQDSLPDTGAPVNAQSSSQLQGMLSQYLSTSMARNWKFWIFSKLVRSLFPSYTNAVDVSTSSTFAADVMTWFDEACRLKNLRPVALKSVTEVSKETSILLNPSNFQNEVEGRIRLTRSRDKNSKPYL